MLAALAQKLACATFGCSVTLLCCCATPTANSSPAGSQEPTTSPRSPSNTPGAIVPAPPAQSAVRFDMGSPPFADLWVDPTSGRDDNPGTDPTKPVRSLTAAWQKVPPKTTTLGYRINLMPGTYPCEPGPEASNCVNYFDGREGAHNAPIVLRASRGRGTATVRGGFNFKGVRFLYLLDLDIVGGGKLPTNSAGNNLLHLEAADHVLLRGVSLRGPDCPRDDCNNLQEVLKANQVQHLFLEDSQVSGAWHSAIDLMVVQYGHVINSRLSTAGQWCLYAKGGSAYLRLEGNEIAGCQLGIQAGQSANFAMMRSPWLHYDAYDVKVVGNVFHDIPGVPLSVAGAYNVVFAHNTLVRVATASTGYPLFQVVQGERNCTPTDELPRPEASCAAKAAEGGWGPVVRTDGAATIPARNVWLLNNLFYNPGQAHTAYAHFAIAAPAPLPPGFKNLPATIPVDQGLVIAGNVLWNGPQNHPLGIEETNAGCQPSHPTCSADKIRRDNTINAIEPKFLSDYRLDPQANPSLGRVAPMPAFTWVDVPQQVPVGQLINGPPRQRPGAL